MNIFKITLPDPSFRISIPNNVSYTIIPLREILYCCAERSYTCVHTINGEKHLISVQIKKVKEELENQGFFLIHKSYLVNLMHIRGISANGENKVTLIDNTKLDISRRRKTALFEIFKSFRNH